MLLIQVLLWAALMAGHIAIWCTIFNQLHATAWIRPIRKTSEKLIYVVFAMIALAISWYWFWGPLESSWSWIAQGYLWCCAFAVFAVAVSWAFRVYSQRPPKSVIVLRKHLVDFQPEIGSVYSGWQAKLLGSIPGNQSLKLSIEHRILELPRWPQELDGLVVAHLSDFHLTGKIGRAYFERVIEQCNECAPDLVCLTGDIVDKENFVDWLAPLLGRVQSTFGKYYCLGNHDTRIDESVLRSAIESTGFQPAESRWRELQIRGSSVFIAGNELPWFPGANRLTNSPELYPKLVLSHSPDQFDWAQSRQVDLMLAGHTHGGQIRIPFIGPIVVPSRFGVKYASGTFQHGETVMHVSRGVSAEDPIRLNCPPELAIFKLNAKTVAR